MRPVTWTPEALARLEDIQAYIAKDAPIIAKEAIARLLERSRQLLPRKAEALQQA